MFPFDIKDNLGLTPLHYCVILNNITAFKLLLEYNANPFIVNNEGANVFELAILYKRNDIFNYLLDKNYNLDFITLSGDTLLQIAVNNSDSYIIDKLLTKKINLNNSNHDYGMTVLHLCVILDNLNLFKKKIQNLLKNNIKTY